MKTQLTLIFIIISCGLNAQDLSNFQLESHYDLTKSHQDRLGRNAAIDTANIGFSNEDGLYSNGIYRYDTLPNGCYLQIDSLPYLVNSDFAFEIEFKAEDMAYRTFMVLGISWRNFTLSFLQDSLLEMTISGRSSIGHAKINKGQWYNLTVIHSREDSTTSFYLDGMPQGTLKQFLDIKQDDTGFTNTHYGRGDVFKGWWKNIKLYRARTNKTLDHSIHLLDVYPNPCQANDVLHFEMEEENEIFVTPLDGTKGFKMNRKSRISKPGRYILKSYSNEHLFQAIVVIL